MAATVGRPTSYKPEYCQKLIDHMATGLSYTTFAAVIDVNTDTLYEWEKKHPQFSEAKKIGFDKCQLFWERVGIEGLWGNKTAQFNAPVWIFNMKNRFKWTDKLELAGDHNKPIQLAYDPTKRLVEGE